MSDNKTAGMIPKPPERVFVIDRPDALREFTQRMAARDWIAVDTEFLRERTYYPRLCLVQIADCDEIGLIDVLAIADLSPLARLLVDPNVVKVFHSAAQDLEVLNLRFGGVPAPLFDTQIAAALLGHADQIGYARLVAALLGVELPKAHTRTDWSARPLEPAALAYAADDVRYLAGAYPLLRAALRDRARLDWLVDECRRLVDPQRFVVDPATAWRRLRHWPRLRGDQQQALAALAEWRERQAMAADRPRKWILSDRALTDIALGLPDTRDALAAIDGLPAKTRARHGDALLAWVRAAARNPPRALADAPEAPDAEHKRLIKLGMARLNANAEAHGIASALIASRRDIARLVGGERELRLLSGWRAQVAGDDIRAAIAAASAPSQG